MKGKPKGRNFKFKQLLVLLLVISMVIGDVGMLVATAVDTKDLQGAEVKVDQNKSKEDKKSVKDLVKKEDERKAAEAKVKEIKDEIELLNDLTHQLGEKDSGYEFIKTNLKEIERQVQAIMDHINEAYAEGEENAIITKDQQLELIADLIGKSGVDEGRKLLYIVNTMYKEYRSELKKAKDENKDSDFKIESAKAIEVKKVIDSLAEKLIELYEKANPELGYTDEKIQLEKDRLALLNRQLDEAISILKDDSNTGWILPNEVKLGKEFEEKVVWDNVKFERARLNYKIVKTPDAENKGGEVVVRGRATADSAGTIKVPAMAVNSKYPEMEFKVVGIADDAFNRNKREASNLAVATVKHLDLSAADNIRYIGDRAFKGHRLEYIVGSIFGKDKTVLDLSNNGNTLEEIGEEAFVGSKVEVVKFGPSVKKLGRKAFANTKVESLEFAAGVEGFDTTYVDIGEEAFINCDLTSLGSGAIEKMGSIGDRAFWGNNLGSEITIPKGTKYIGTRAFGGKTTYSGLIKKTVEKETNLKEVNFQEYGQLREIKEEAFINHSIEHLEFPRSLQQIGKKAFYAQNANTRYIDIEEVGLLDEILKKEEEEYKTVGKDQSLIAKAKELGEKGLNLLKDKDQINKEELEALELETSTINESGSYKGNSLRFVKFYPVTNNGKSPEHGVTSIGREAFAMNPVQGTDYKRHDNNLYIPGSLYKIEDKIFYGNDATIISFDEGIKDISGYKAFASLADAKDPSLRRVELPKSLQSYSSTYAFDNNGIKRVFFKKIGGREEVFNFVEGKDTGFFGASPKIEYIEYPDYYDNLIPNNFSNDGYEQGKINQRNDYYGRLRVVSYNKDAKALITGKDDMRNVATEVVGYKSMLDNLEKQGYTTKIIPLRFAEGEYLNQNKDEKGENKGLEGLPENGNLEYLTHITINEYLDGKVGDRNPDQDTKKDEIVIRDIDMKLVDFPVKGLKNRKVEGIYLRKAEVGNKSANIASKLNAEIKDNGNLELKIPRDKYFGNEGIYIAYSAEIEDIKALKPNNFQGQIEVNGVAGKKADSEIIKFGGLAKDLTAEEQVDENIDELLRKLLVTAEKGLKADKRYTDSDILEMEGILKDTEDIINSLDGDTAFNLDKDLEPIRDLLEKEKNALEIAKRIDKVNKDNYKEQQPGITKAIEKLEADLKALEELENSDDEKDIIEQNIKNLNDLRESLEDAKTKEALPEEYFELKDGLEKLEAEVIKAEGEAPVDKEVKEALEKEIARLGRKLEELRDIDPELAKELEAKKDGLADRINKLEVKGETSPEEDLDNKIDDIINNLGGDEDISDKLDELKELLEGLEAGKKNEKIKELLDKILENLINNPDKITDENFEALLEGLKDLISQLPEEDQAKYNDLLDLLGKLMEDPNKDTSNKDQDQKVKDKIKELLKELSSEDPDEEKLKKLLKELKDLISQLPDDEKSKYEDIVKDLEDKIGVEDKDSEDKENKEVEDKIGELLEELGKDKPNEKKLEDLLKELKDLISKLPKDEQAKYKELLKGLEDTIKNLGTDKEDQALEELVDQLLSKLEDALSKENPNKEDLGKLLDEIEKLIGKLPKDERAKYDKLLEGLKDKLKDLGKEENKEENKKDVEDKIGELLKELAKNNPNKEDLKKLLKELKDLVEKLPEDEQAKYKELIEGLEDTINNLGTDKEGPALENLVDQLISKLEDALNKENPNKEDLEKLLGEIEDLIKQLPEKDQPKYDKLLESLRDKIKNLEDTVKPENPEEAKKEADRLIKELFKELGKEEVDRDKLDQLMKDLEGVIEGLSPEDKKEYKKVLDGFKDLLANLDQVDNNSEEKEAIEKLLDELMKELGKEEVDSKKVKELEDEIRKLIEKLEGEDKKAYEDRLKNILDIADHLNKENKTEEEKEADKLLKELLDKIAEGEASKEELEKLVKELEELIKKLPKEDQDAYNKLLEDLLEGLKKKPELELKKEIDKLVKDLLEELGKEEPNEEKIEKLVEELKDKIAKLEDGKEKEDYEELLSKLEDLKDTVIKDEDKDEDGGSIIIPPVKPDKPTDGEEDEDKDEDGDKTEKIKSYLSGYPDGTVRPNVDITREEVATILFMLGDYDLKDVKAGSHYTDVKSGRWSERYITHLTNEGILVGYGNATFKPEEKMTRAEFLTAMAQFKKITNIQSKGSVGFNDTKGHWAEDYISMAVKEGWIVGYPDGSFKPDGKITRAEVAVVVNKAMGYEIKDNMLVNNAFDDIIEGKWYYDDMIIATGSLIYKK